MKKKTKQKFKMSPLGLHNVNGGLYDVLTLSIWRVYRPFVKILDFGRSHRWTTWSDLVFAYRRNMQHPAVGSGGPEGRRRPTAKYFFRFFDKNLERSYIVLLRSRRQRQGELCYFKSHLDCLVFCYYVVSLINVNSRARHADARVSFLEIKK